MKRALITGSTKGIGLDIAKKLLYEGYFVYMSYLKDDENAQNVCSQLEVQYLNNFQMDKVDFSSYDDSLYYVRKLKKEMNSLDILIFNATMTDRTSLEDMQIGKWEQIMRINVSVPFLLVKELLPCIIHGEDKVILFTGSSMGIYPHPLSLAYGVAKSAEHSLAKNLVKFLEPYHIRINVVAPSFVETEMQKNKPQYIRKNIYDKIAVHRFADSEEIADAMLFVIKNKYMNGTVLEIDGGYCYK